MVIIMASAFGRPTVCRPGRSSEEIWFSFYFLSVFFFKKVFSVLLLVPFFCQFFFSVFFSSFFSFLFGVWGWMFFGALGKEHLDLYCKDIINHSLNLYLYFLYYSICIIILFLICRCSIYFWMLQSLRMVLK